jgi:hypothetical protein
MKNWRQTLIAATLLVWCSNTAVSETILDIKLIMQEEEYLSGETVYFFLDACNPSDQPYTETFSCVCCIFQISIIDTRDSIVAHYDEGKECSQTPVRLDWKPNGCLSLGPFTWLQTRGGFPMPGDGDQISPGDYRVRAKWENGPVVESNPITILNVDQSPPGPTFSWAGVLFVLLLAVGLGGILFFLLRRK